MRTRGLCANHFRKWHKAHVEGIGRCDGHRQCRECSRALDKTRNNTDERRAQKREAYARKAGNVK